MLNTSRGELLVSLPAAIPLQSAADGVQVEEVVEDRGSEYARAEDSFGTIGAIAAIGAAFAVVGAVMWFRLRARARAVSKAHSDAMTGLAHIFTNDEKTLNLMRTMTALRRNAKNPMLTPLKELFEHSAIVMQHDHRAQGALGRIGLSVFLHDFWEARGDTARMRAMGIAVKLTHSWSTRSLAGAANVHAGVARELADQTESGPMFARMFHHFAGAQLMFRHAMLSREPRRLISALESAYKMINAASTSIDTLRSEWAGVRGEEAQAVTGGHGEEVTQDIEPGVRTDRGEVQRSNALQRIMLIAEPTDALEREIWSTIRTMREKDYGPKGGDGTGSGPISFMRGVSSPMPRGGPSGSNSTAFSPLAIRPIAPLANFRSSLFCPRFSLFMRPAMAFR